MALSTKKEVAERVERAIRNEGLPQKLRLTPGSEGDVGDIIDGALAEYSHDRPRALIHSIAGDGATRRWVLPDAIASWEAGFSSILGFRLHSATDANDLGRDLKGSEWAVLDEDVSGATKEVLLLEFAPSGNEKLDVRYGVRHELTDDANSILPRHQEAFAALAISRACLWIAQRAADYQDQRTTSDVVNFQNLATVYRRQAETWKAQYDEVVLGKGSEAPAAGGMVEMEDRIRDRHLATHRVYPRPL